MLNAFRAAGLLEALSFLYLLAVAMPQKYVGGDPKATFVPGMIHGVLFMAYMGIALALSDRENWPKRKLGHAFLGAVLPFGTLVFDFKYLKRPAR